MDFLALRYRGQEIRAFALQEFPLVLGKRADCDIVVQDHRLPEHAFWIVPGGNAVQIEPVQQGQETSQRLKSTRVTLHKGEEMSLTPEYSLKVVERNREGRTRSDTRTDPNRLRASAGKPLSLVLERPSGIQHIPLHSEPYWIGSGSENDLTVEDEKVSARHCRLEPGRFGWCVRDLGSRNGTFVNGLATDRGAVAAGSQIRVGDTVLRIVADPPKGKARGECKGPVSSSRMRRVHRDVERFAQLSWPVLIGGESGSGKEIIARALHEQGPRSRHPFVAINAAAIAPNLIESELFGHKRGAFSGAVSDHRGLFELANKGTLFLDEIAELPLSLQARLLRVLENWRVRPVGSERWQELDVRLVCASHRDLLGLADRGGFRHDLYYRLARLILRVPPLRERKSDIPRLAERFLTDVENEVGVRRLSEEAVDRLMTYRWPGNVRELKNVVCCAAASTTSATLQLTDIERAIVQIGGSSADRGTDPMNLARAVQQHGGNLSAAARALGIPRTTLRDRLRGATNPAPEESALDSLAVESPRR